MLTCTCVRAGVLDSVPAFAEVVVEMRNGIFLLTPHHHKLTSYSEATTISLSDHYTTVGDNDWPVVLFLMSDSI